MAGKRSIKFTKKHYDLAQRLAANGLSRLMIAQALGMSEATLYRRLENDARLKECLAIGDQEDVQLCVNVLREKALQGSAQHMDRYLQLRHGIYIGGAKPQGFERREGPLIVVVPFQTGQDKWELDNTLSIEQDGETIDGEFDTELVHNHLIEQNMQ